MSYCLLNASKLTKMIEISEFSRACHFQINDHLLFKEKKIISEHNKYILCASLILC